jgi:GlpG protein
VRNIGRFDDEGTARVFSDFLYAQDIDNHVDEDLPSWVVWVHDDAHLASAREALEQYRRAPNDQKFHQARLSARKMRDDTARRDTAYRERIRLARLSMHGAQARGDVTRGLLVISVMVAFLSQAGTSGEALSSLFLTNYPSGALLPEVRGGEIWRLFTPALIHYGVWHLLFNMWLWWSFGQRVESRKGAIWFTVFVVLASVFCNMTEFTWSYLVAPGVIWRMGGMSGVLYALFGFVLVKGKLDPLDELEVDPVTTAILLLWLVFGMLGGLGNVANGTHLGGLIFGVVWALGDIAWFRWRKRMG